MAARRVARVRKLFFCCALIIGINSAGTTDPAFGNGYPPFWDRAPGALDQYTKQAGQIVINPWNYLERMGMYKILIHSSDKYFGKWGLNNTENFLWGLALQHGWQLETGRLADHSKTTTCGEETLDPLCISVYSWWACMNYDLSVVPFLAAADAGIFEKWQEGTHMMPPQKFSTDFCYTIAGCHSTLTLPMAKWKYFFQLLKSATAITDGDVSSSVDNLLKYMWDAHESSIMASLPKFPNRLRFLSGPEGQFGEDWATAVHFIAATYFLTDFENTNTFQAFLPPRMLTVTDQAPKIPDFSEGQNRVLSRLRSLNNKNTMSGGTLLWMWKKAMCTEQGREAGRAILQNMATSPSFPFAELLRILQALAHDPKCII